MTAVANLVDRLLEKGVMMRRNGDNLILDGPVEVLTDELVEQVRAAKFGIMRTLEERETSNWHPLCEDRAAVADHDCDLPREWAEGLAALNAMTTPPDIPEARWSRIVDDAARFADRWGRQAVDLGWSLHDVFGCHPARPRERTDQAGLV